MKKKLVKKILMDIDKNCDLCFLCKNKGVVLCECQSETSEECAEKIIKLYKGDKNDRKGN